jgi:hypothetical protein
MKLAFAPFPAVLALALTACASETKPPDAAPRVAPDWRSIITDDDRARLREWRAAWTRALAKAQAAGHGAAVAREGVLLQPDAALGWADPPPGHYRCRTIKLGSRSPGLLAYVAYPPFDCRIRPEDGVTSFAKLGGSQRQIGLLFPDAGNRRIFLGTLQLGDETEAQQYGRDRERDLVALVERIGERRWRLVFPSPHFESDVDIVELVPRTPE